MTSRTKNALYQGLAIVPEAHSLSLLAFIGYAIWHSPYIFLMATMLLFSPVVVMVLAYFDHRHHSYSPGLSEFMKTVNTASTQNIITMPLFVTATLSEKSCGWVREKTQMLVVYEKHALCFGLQRVPICHFISVVSVIFFLQTQELRAMWIALTFLFVPIFIGLWSLFFFDHHGFDERNMSHAIKNAVLLNIVTCIPYLILSIYCSLIIAPYEALVKYVEKRIRQKAH